jgi:UDP-N-acetylmuramoylalanine--D-glutamate ligase
MNKKIVILGAAESGVGAAILAKKHGFEVFVSDFGEIKQEYKEMLINHSISFEEKKHSNDLILSADEIIKSPGIADKTPVIQAIKAKGIKIISDIEFAGRYTNAKKICITGSNGKTTTTLLIYHVMMNSGLNVGLAGNVGKSFALQVAENKFDYYVIELSSFQLDYMFDFKADIAILMNITPDHLDRYNYEFQNYIDSKFRIVQNQTEQDYFIYCDDDEVIKSEIAKRDINATMLPFSIINELKQGAFLTRKK